MILSHISQPLLGLVDIAVLGHLDDPQYLASVALGATIIGFIYWCFGFLRMGTTANAAQAFGANNNIELVEVLWRATLLASLIASFIVIFHGSLFGFGMWALDIPEHLDSFTRSYLNIRLFSSPAALINYVIAGWFIGQQRPKIALLCVIASNGSNIVLDIVFVLFLGLASDGVAWATVLSEYFAVLVGLLFVWRHHGMQFKTINASAIVNSSALLRLINQNSLLFIRTFLLLLTMAFMTKQSAALGINVLAANTIVLQLAMLVAYGLDGFANAAESLVGEAIGATSISKLSLAIQGTGWMSVIVSLSFVLPFYFGQSLILNIMTSHAEVLVLLQQYYYVIYLFCLVGCWSFWLDGVFIGANRFTPMMLTMLMSSLLFLAAWWMLRDFKNHGLWAAYLIFLTARGLSLGVISYRYSKTKAWFKTA